MAVARLPHLPAAQGGDSSHHLAVSLMAIARSLDAIQETLESIDRRLSLVHREAVSQQEAAEILGLGRSTTYELLRQRHIPNFALGQRQGGNRHRVLVPRYHIRRWLRERAERGEFVEI